MKQEGISCNAPDTVLFCWILTVETVSLQDSFCLGIIHNDSCVNVLAGVYMCRECP